jgi:8-oxo-dGTP diphosphatase
VDNIFCAINFNFYPIMSKIPRLATSLLLFNESRFLLCQRKFAPGIGLWAIPGGKVNFGEALLFAAQRELLEETCIESSLYEIRKEPYDITEYMDADFHYVIVQYLAKVKQGVNVVAIAGDDAQDVRWFTREEMSKVKLTGKMELTVDQAIKCIF